MSEDFHVTLNKIETKAHCYFSYETNSSKAETFQNLTDAGWQSELSCQRNFCILTSFLQKFGIESF